ncbi:MAG: hypothetical protein V4649_12195 [Bacteroidota bacterium]
MTLAAAKEKLHTIIDQADKEKVFALLSLFEPTYKVEYDEETVNMLNETVAEYLAGKSPGYTVEESMEQLQNGRKTL